MPTSPYAHIEYLVALLIDLKPNSILDIGIGNGKIGYVARDLLDVTLNEQYKKENWKVKIDGIEVFEPYIQSHQRYIYNDIYIGDAYDVIDNLGIYDLIIIGDVLEHFPKEKGWLFLDKCAMHSSKFIIVSIPIGETVQEALYNNDFERHLSYWNEEDFKNIQLTKKMFTLSIGIQYGVFLIDKNRLLVERIRHLEHKAYKILANGDIDSTIETLKYINILKPDFYENQLNLGILFAQKGDLNSAIKYFKKVLELNPQSSVAHYNIAKAYKDQGNYPYAIEHYLDSLSINPFDPEPAYNLGNIYAELDRYEEAVVAYTTALTIKPDHINALNNLGAVKHILCQLDSAIECYDRIIQTDPTNADAHYNKSLSLLLKGEFKEGWRLYEWRFKRKDYPPRTYPMKLWDGKTFKGNLLIYAEQGLGDTIQFIRYTRLLTQLGLDVFLHCHDELVSLLKNCTTGFCDVISFNHQYPMCDFYFPLMSLPLVFQTDLDSIPSEVPYIWASSEYIKKWKQIIGNDSSFKVGIVWTGKPEHKYTRMRSIKLKTFEPLFSTEGITFFSIQKGDAAKEVLEYRLIRDYTDKISDFSDTAGFIECLDLIITVDTSVAHLAGAMSKPVWILLPFSPDWRWLLGIDESPWYKTARLFRQKNLGQWSDVILHLKKELEQLIKKQITTDKHL